MAKQISEHAMIGKIIRKQLKEAGIKARVRTDYNSVNINMVDPETPEWEQKAYEIGYYFKAGNFNGMTDMYEYDPEKRDRPTVQFVFVNIEWSEDYQKLALQILKDEGLVDNTIEYGTNEYHREKDRSGIDYVSTLVHKMMQPNYMKDADFSMIGRLQKIFWEKRQSV